MKKGSKISVRRKPLGAPYEGLLSFRGRIIGCRLGKTGITVLKREGDRATPAGTMRMISAFQRFDRTQRQTGSLPVAKITPSDGWCDQPNHSRYNRHVRLPFAGEHERLTRTDRLYDRIVVLDWNYTARIRGRGSAIFFHLSSQEGKGTLGCVAVEPYQMRRLWPHMKPGLVMEILP